MAHGPDMIPVSTTVGRTGPTDGGRFSDTANGSTFAASESATIARLRRRDGAPHADGNRPDLPPTFAADAGKARASYLAAYIARAAVGLSGAAYRAADAAAYARNAADRDDRKRTDGRRRGKTLRALDGAQQARSAARQGALPSEAYGAERFDPSLARALRANAADAVLASRHGAARKADGARPTPRDHFAPRTAMLSPGARIVHVDPVAVGPMGHVKAESAAEARANDRAYLDALVTLAPSVKAIDGPACERIARGLLALRAAGLACAEANVFRALRHGARKRIGGLLAQAG